MVHDPHSRGFCEDFRAAVSSHPLCNLLFSEIERPADGLCRYPDTSMRAATHLEEKRTERKRAEEQKRREARETSLEERRKVSGLGGYYSDD